MSVSTGGQLTIADEVWIAVALLHREFPDRSDFTVREIAERVREAAITDSVRSGLEVTIRQHAVANRPRSANRGRMLFATAGGRRRLFRPGDWYHPTREGGRTLPARQALPERYRHLFDWYGSEFARQAEPEERPDPILELRGLGKEIWGEEEPDAYVNRLRQSWG